MPKNENFYIIKNMCYNVEKIGCDFMSGRHGKLTGSPYHVITNRTLAGEKYGDEASQPKPLCKYRKNGCKRTDKEGTQD